MPTHKGSVQTISILRAHNQVGVHSIGVRVVVLGMRDTEVVASRRNVQNQSTFVEQFKIGFPTSSKKLNCSVATILALVPRGGC